MNWYTYCYNNPLFYFDPYGTDARVMVNTKGAIFEAGPIRLEVLRLGHMGIMVQNEKGEWYYFSCGAEYVTFEKVEDEFLDDITTFSKEYYGGGLYDESVYVKGDFSEAFKYFEAYHKENKSDDNAIYDSITNNCSHVVMEGFKKGIVGDGTSVGDYMAERVIVFPLIPKSQIEQLQEVFYNNAFTHGGAHQQLNDKLWNYRNSPYIWERSKNKALHIERIIYVDKESD